MSGEAATQDQPLRLLLLGDSCSGVPGAAPERNLRTVVQAILARPRSVDALCYLGDHIAGYTSSESELAAQWRHFLTNELPPLTERFRIYHLASNHTAYDAVSSALYDRVLPARDQDGVVAHRGLNYAVRQRGALLVFLNTADPENRGAATLDLGWLGDVLADHASVPVKVVFGHHPIHPVNGYTRYPLWRVRPDRGAEAWALLRRFEVGAYVCSHILAFDFQVHDGIVQICSGGGGTVYGPGGLMPAAAEYHHFVECSIAAAAIRCDVYDAAGRLRERVGWPLDLTSSVWTTLSRSAAPVELAPPAGWGDRRDLRAGFALSVSGTAPTAGTPAAVLCGWAEAEGPPILWIGFEGSPLRLVVKAIPVPGDGPQTWAGPALEPGGPFALWLAVDPGAGPGGVLARLGDGAWSSLTAACARGLDRMAWPERWAVGHGHQGPDDAPLAVPDLHVEIASFDRRAIDGRSA